MASEYGVLVCPKCGNDSSSEDGISYAYLEWRVHQVIRVDGEMIIIRNDSESADIGWWGGDKATVTNTPDNQRDCAHFHCEACRWNWWDDCDKDFR